MQKYTAQLFYSFKNWLHGLQFDFGFFMEILRPLITIVILGACFYFFLKPPKA